MEKPQNLINVHDYPDTKYSATWEIFIHSVTHEWVARILPYGAGGAKEQKSGKGASRDESRKQSQQWVLSVIEKYRRSDAEIAKLPVAKPKTPEKNPEDAIVGNFVVDVDDLEFDVGREAVTITSADVGTLKI